MTNWRDRKHLRISRFGSHLQTFLAIFSFKAHLILKRLLFMDLFKYFKLEGKCDCLPDPLNKQVPLSSVEEANKEVNSCYKETSKKSILPTILQHQSRKSRWGNMRW